MKIFGSLKNVLFGKNALSSIFWFTLLGYLRPAINIFLLPVYLLYLSPEDYGILSLVGVFTAIIIVFVNAKLDMAVGTYYFDYNHEESLLKKYLSQVFSLTLYMAAFFFVLLLFTGPFLYDLFFVSEKVVYYPLGLVALATASIALCNTVYFIYLKNKVKLREFFIYSVAGIILTIMLQLYFVISQGEGVLGVLKGYLFPAALIFIVIVIRTPGLITFRFDKNLLLPSLKFSLPLVPLAFLMVFEKQLDRLVLEKYFSLEEVGVYAVLITLVGMAKVLLTALDNAVRPFLYEALKKPEGSNIKKINRFFGLYILIGLVGLSGIILIGSNIHFFTDNPKYLEVKQYFVLACTATIPIIFIRFYGLIYFFYKKSGSLSLITFVKTILVFLLLVLLIPPYGIYGAIIAVLLANLLNQFAFNWQIKKFGAPVLSLIRPLLRVLIFLIVSWAGYILMKENFLGLYGLLQFLLISSILISLNRKNLINLAKNDF